MEQQVKEFGSLIDLVDHLEMEGISGPRKTKAIRDFLFLRARKKGVPYSGGFELTPLCNFDCKMCYVHLSKLQMQKEQELLPTETWIDIIRQAADAGLMYADLTGGECLTYPGFKDVYLYLLSRGVRVSVLTNGFLMTKEMVQFFCKHRPEMIQVSVYGSNRFAYQKVTGCDAFQTVMKNLNYLKASALPSKVVIMPHRYMEEDMSNLLELIHAINMDYTIGDVNLPPRDNTGRSFEDYVASTKLAVDLKVTDLKYRSQHAEKWHYIPPYRFEVKDSETKGGIPCASGRCSFHVNWRGEVTPCVPYYKVCKSALAEGFLPAWQHVRKQMESYQKPRECLACDMQDKCSICPAEKTFGILNGPLNTVVCRRLRGILEAGNEEAKQ